MTLIDWLRKLGILRFGAEKAVYRNALEQPYSMMDGDVFDSQKDVIELHRRKKDGEQEKTTAA
ncbi:MAG: hypothetical protein KatS3mg024_2327 [Armatimonadota bacterium]|nr:MAG: hypothetical protein KatS3mg024_2327 [Armatimonadota bacterium]